jgi:hypothetical protein
VPPPQVLTAARSGLPSAFRSPIATVLGTRPVRKSRLDWNVPSPLFTSSETVRTFSFAVTRSGLWSPRRVQKLGSRSESRLGTDIDSFGLP